MRSPNSSQTKESSCAGRSSSSSESAKKKGDWRSRAGRNLLSALNKSKQP
jgi:hypothetical protein